MGTIRWGFGVVVAAMVGCWSGSALAGGPSAAQRCEAQKNQAAGAKAVCLAGEYAKGVLGQTPNFARCESAFTIAFLKAEQRAGAGGCPTAGDTAAIEAQVDVGAANLAAALSGAMPPATHEFPATGQTTCWNSAGTVTPCFGTGQDGNIRAGGALSYTDNGDGTITDNNTGLMWEKKSDDGSIHDKDTFYSWDGAYTFHIAGLNSTAFAGYTDWRLPNVKELLSIVNYGTFSPAVSGAFNNACAAGCTVLACSCTANVLLWSSSTEPDSPTSAWVVTSGNGAVSLLLKNQAGLNARAVRGGL